MFLLNFLSLVLVGYPAGDIEKIIKIEEIRKTFERKKKIVTKMEYKNLQIIKSKKKEKTVHG